MVKQDFLAYAKQAASRTAIASTRLTTEDVVWGCLRHSQPQAAWPCLIEVGRISSNNQNVVAHAASAIVDNPFDGPTATALELMRRGRKTNLTSALSTTSPDHIVLSQNSQRSTRSRPLQRL